jgi:4-hydroxybenzoate polyprenyltransferase
LLKKLLSVFFFANVFISFAAAALTFSTFKFTEQSPLSLSFSCFVFFATLFIYNLQRLVLTQKTEQHETSERLIWINKNRKTIFVFCLIGLFGTVELFLHYFFFLTPFLSFLFLLSFSYFFPFINLRKKAWLKTLVLTSVWTSVVTLLPILITSYSNAAFDFGLREIVVLCIRFSFIFGLCMVFDVRDLQVDFSKGVHTIASQLGEKKTKLYSILIIVLSLFFVGVGFVSGVISTEICLAITCSELLSIALLSKASSGCNEMYYVFGVDGMLLLQAIIMLLV